MSYVDHIIESNDETGQQVSHEIRDANAQGRIATLEAGIDDVVDTATAAATQATQAAQTASDAAKRAEDAIDAIGDISELPVPLMSPDVRGGAKLDESGGLALRDGALGVGSLVQESTGEVRGPIAELTAEGWAEQDTTTGKNLLPPMYYRENNAYFVAHDSTHAHRMRTSSFAVSANTVYTLSGMPSGTRLVGARCFNSAQQDIGDASVSGSNITTLANAAYMFILFGDDSNTYTEATKQVFIDSVQLEAGSTATSYEPYTGGAPSPSPDYPQEIRVARGHEIAGQTGRYVDLIVKDANDVVLSTTPIPLPAKGFAASLADGTADTLSVDSAGRCEWVNESDEVVFDGSGDEGWELQNGGKRVSANGTSSYASPVKLSSSSSVINVMCSHFRPVSVNTTWVGTLGVAGNSGYITGTSFAPLNFSDGTGAMTVANWTTWLASNPVTVLYPLATPVTEDMGYVEDWPTKIPEGAAISIPELDAVKIKYFIGSAVIELARQWYERANSEYADRITALEQAVAKLATS